MFSHLDYSTIVQSNNSSELDTVGGGDPELASNLRIEERELEAGGLN
jgi:hypothetical protein